MKFSAAIIILFLLTFFIGCNESGKKDKSVLQEKFEVKLNEAEKPTPPSQANQTIEDAVFYNMFSPLDLDKVIDAKSSYFNSSYINSLNNLTKYVTSHKIALNIGIYGADLSYLWMFEQNQQALSYLSAIQHLTAKLGIPDTFVQNTVKAAESNSGEIDSLIPIAKKAYYDTDKYLKINGREGSAALVLLGGWIESLNIALNMYTEPNAKLASKIITQKYALASLMNMVQNSQDDIIMSEYLLLMKKLNDSFKVLESKLKPDDIDIDTINKHISIKDTDNLKLNPNEFRDIKLTTAKIRERIIE